MPLLALQQLYWQSGTNQLDPLPTWSFGLPTFAMLRGTWSFINTVTNRNTWF